MLKKDDLLTAVDSEAAQAGTNRSALIQAALAAYLWESAFLPDMSIYFAHSHHPTRPTAVNHATIPHKRRVRPGASSTGPTRPSTSVARPSRSASRAAPASRATSRASGVPSGTRRR